MGPRSLGGRPWGLGAAWLLVASGLFASQPPIGPAAGARAGGAGAAAAGAAAEGESKEGETAVANPEAAAEAAAGEEEAVWHPFTWSKPHLKFTVLGGALVRYDIFNNFDFDERIDDSDAEVMEQLRLGFELDVHEQLRLHLELQESREQDSRVQLAPDDDGTEVRRASATLYNLGPISVTAGRQDLSFGAGHIIDPYDFRVLDTHFDAGRVDGTFGDVEATIYYARPVDQLPDPNSGSEHIEFFGLHAGWTVLPELQAELLYLHYRDDREEFGGIPAEVEEDPPVLAPSTLDLDLVGLRLSGKVLDELVFDVEAAGQFGDFGPNALGSFAVWSKLGYNFRGVFAEPYVGAEYNYSTGDADPGDRDTNTWVSLFPSISNYSFYTLSNLRETVFTLILTPLESLELEVDYRLLRLNERRDALYDEDFKFYLSDPTGNSGTDLGQELDFNATYTLFEHLDFEAAYAKLYSGQFPKGVTGDDAGPFYGYVQARIKF
ncbi:MAG: alginate export family protein [Planctomycetes bacterium]|nr:alginate export family protein [Planctomycetota bacterium]